MQLRCKSCGRELHARDVDFEALDASCRHCGWRFGTPIAPYRSAPEHVDDRVSDPLEEDGQEPVRPLSQRLPWPAGVLVRRSAGRGRIRFTLHPRAPRPLVLAAAVLTATLAALAIGVAWQVGATSPVLLVSVAISPLFGAYATTALARNHVVVSADPDGIRVDPGPLPWFGSRVLPRASIEQLWVAVRESAAEGGRRTYYELRARTPAGDVELVSDIESARAALYLEKVIEDHLGVVDVPIFGQYNALSGTASDPEDPADQAERVDPE